MNVSHDMVGRALNAWFKSPPSETDMGLERSMKAALEAALSAESSETKIVYVKRWRTLVRLPIKYADEIVEALRCASTASLEEMGRYAALCPPPPGLVHETRMELLTIREKMAKAAAFPRQEHE